MPTAIFPALQWIASSLVRRTWFVGAVTTIVCAGLAARAASSVMAAELESSAGVARSAPVHQPRFAPPQPGAPDPEALVARNIFCSSCGPEVTSRPGPGAGSPATARFAGVPAILVATTIGTSSHATVQVPSTGGGGDYGIGDRIAQVGTVAWIGMASIDVVDAAGVHERLTLLDPLQLPAAVSGSMGAATPSSETAASPFADRLSKRADGSFDVDRSLVRDLVSGAAKAGNVRLFPIMKGSDVTGVRVLGVKADSLAAALGMTSGDTITTINGDALTTAQQLIDLLAGLDQLSTVTVGGTHGKAALAMKLHLR